MRMAVNQLLNPMLFHDSVHFLTIDIGNVHSFLPGRLPAGFPHLASQRSPLRQRQGQRLRLPSRIANLRSKGLIVDIVDAERIAVQQ